MKKVLTLFLFFLLSFQGLKLNAQTDTCFWFAVPFSSPDAGPRHDYKVHLYSYGNTTTIRVRQPALLMDTTFSIPPYSSFDYIFWFDKLASTTNLAFDSLEAKPADMVLNYGLKITADHDISAVFDMVTTGNNPETFSLKGRKNGIGLEFYCPFQQKGNNQTLANAANTPPGIVQPKQQINIIATDFNTIVSITPKCNVIGHLANITYTVLLPTPGKVYTIENASQTTTVLANNLSGTHIIANKPISVTVADDCVKGLAGCYDMIGDQIVPVNKVGSDYVIVKGNINATENEGVYVVATNNNTTLNFDDGVTTTTVINAGDTYFYKTNQQLTSLKTTSDVYVMHLTGFGCEMSAGLVPPLACAGSTITHFTRNNAQQFNLNIYCKNGAQSTFTLDGSTTLVPASAFTVVPGTATLAGGPYYGAKISFNTTFIPIGAHIISNSANDFGLSLCNGGATSGTFYHYMTEFQKKTSVAVSTLAPQCSIYNVVNLTGIISGASSTGTWTTNGNGIFGPYTSTSGTISTTYTLTAQDTSFTSLTFYLTSTGSCKPVKDSVVLQLIPPPYITLSSGSLICKYSLAPISLTATFTNAVSGGWSGGSGTFSVSGPSTIYYPSLADYNSPWIPLTYTTTGGCFPSAAAIAFTVIPSPTVNANTNMPLLCAGQQATLTASGANTYMWNTASTNTAIVISPSVTTIYTVTGAAVNGCTHTVTFTQNVSLCTGIAKNTNAKALIIYPNPNNGEFVIEANENMQLQLINELGQVIKTISITSADKKTIVKDLAKGIYFINGNINGKSINEKIIVH